MPTHGCLDATHVTADLVAIVAVPLTGKSSPNAGNSLFGISYTFVFFPLVFHFSVLSTKTPILGSKPCDAY